jgi:hypothetical protein
MVETVEPDTLLFRSPRQGPYDGGLYLCCNGVGPTQQHRIIFLTTSHELFLPRITSAGRNNTAAHSNRIYCI